MEMTKLLKHQDSHVYMKEFRGCKWALLQIFDFHRRLRITKLLSDKKYGEGSSIYHAPYYPLYSQEIDAMDHQTDLQIVPSKQSTAKSQSQSSKKSKSKSKYGMISFISRRFYRKQGQKQKILPLSPKLIRTISIHHLECDDYVTPTKSKTDELHETDSSERQRVYFSPLTRYPDSSNPERNLGKSQSLPSKVHQNYNSDSIQITKNTPKDSENNTLKHIISMEGVIDKIPYGRKLPENSPKLKLFRSTSASYDRDTSSNLNSNIKNINRSRSLNESLGRYSHLIESVSGQSASKTMQSLSKTAQRENYDENCEGTNLMREGDETRVPVAESGPLVSELKGLEDSPVSVLDSSLSNGPVSPVKYQTLEDTEIEPRTPNLDELDSSFDSKITCENYENALPNLEFLPPTQLNQNNELEFNQLGDLFEKFGFGKEDFAEIFDSLNQEVYQETNLSPNLKFDPSRFVYYDDMSVDQNLLFGLTKESLLEIYEKKLSHDTVNSLLNGPTKQLEERFVFKDLWAKINLHLNSNCWSFRDFSKKDGWLNLWREKECLGIELEDLILDGLIEELVLSG